MVEYVRRYADDMRHWPDNVAIWIPGGEVPEPGDRLVQADLGSVLQFLCDEERAAGGDRMGGLAAVRRGVLPRRRREPDPQAPARARRAARRRGPGIVPLPGAPLGRAPASGSTARRSRCTPCGAWCQGPFLLEALSIAEAADLPALGYGTDGYLHAVAETLKLTFADREGYLGDPDFVDVPVDTLGRTGPTPPNAAGRSTRGTLRPGCPFRARFPATAHSFRQIAGSEVPVGPPPDTSIVCVVDKEGNGLCSDSVRPRAGTPRGGPEREWRCRLAGPSRGRCGGIRRASPPASAPASPRTPAFVQSPGRWIMPFGTPGGTPRSRRTC